jgi:hypothetical protein
MVLRRAWLAAVVVLTAALPVAAAPSLPGSTHALVSYVDVDSGFVEVRRHWPWAPTDVQVVPYRPYFWNTCLPGDGAILILLTSPLDVPPPWAALSPYYTPATAPELFVQTYVLGRLGQLGRALGPTAPALARALLQAVTPGTVSYEAVKAAWPFVTSLRMYEHYGFATFLLIRWEWRFPLPGCYPRVVSVPEGYGIPDVR